jgi:hypothetical protein
VSSSSSTCRLNAVMIGVINTVWAMIMAAGVYRNCRKPSGPALDNIM